MYFMLDVPRNDREEENPCPWIDPSEIMDGALPLKCLKAKYLYNDNQSPGNGNRLNSRKLKHMVEKHKLICANIVLQENVSKVVELI